MDPKCRMGLVRRSERFLHPDVELLRSRLEPHAAAGTQRLWLLHLGQAEQLPEEPSRRGFATSWRRYLNMIESLDEQRTTIYPQLTGVSAAAFIAFG
jgi:hypothetical protein